MDDPTRILFVRPRGGKNAIFMTVDKEILSKHFRVQVLDAVWREKGMLSIILVPLRILKGTLQSDVTFTWFAGAHAFFSVLWSRMLGKKSIVTVGGWEVARVLEIRYGLSFTPLAPIVRYTLNHADLVLVVDESLKTQAIENIGAGGSNIRTVPIGCDYEMFKPAGKKEAIALTVGMVGDDGPRRKGIDIFMKASKYLPDVKFIWIGGPVDESTKELRALGGDNVDSMGRIPSEELLSIFQKSKVYCQLSLHEGLPAALCEAMLCECVPVVTDVCGMPASIGDTGFVVPASNPEAAADAIRKALASNKGAKAGERVRTLYPIERRERELVRAVREVTKKDSLDS
jgi:glycosyltransferase involved in cell wall biosynthesis